MAGRQDWFRRATWTSGDRAAFELRLGRSRTAFHKARYLRIQALHLVQDPQPPLHEAALELLDRLLREFPGSFAAWRSPPTTRGMPRRNAAHKRGGQCLSRCFGRGALYPGVQGHAYLDLAELVLALGRADLYAEMLDIITTRQPSEIFPVAQYRALGAAAFLAERMGSLEDARSFATQALSAAAQTETPFRYHRTWGSSIPMMKACRRGSGNSQGPANRALQRPALARRR